MWILLKKLLLPCLHWKATNSNRRETLWTLRLCTTHKPPVLRRSFLVKTEERSTTCFRTRFSLLFFWMSLLLFSKQEADELSQSQDGYYDDFFSSVPPKPNLERFSGQILAYIWLVFHTARTPLRCWSLLTHFSDWIRGNCPAISDPFGNPSMHNMSSMHSGKCIGKIEFVAWHFCICDIEVMSHVLQELNKKPSLADAKTSFFQHSKRLSKKCER